MYSVLITDWNDGRIHRNEKQIRIILYCDQFYLSGIENYDFFHRKSRRAAVLMSRQRLFSRSTLSPCAAGTTAPPSCRCQACGTTGWRSGWPGSPPSPTSCSPCWGCGWWRGWDAGSSSWAATQVRPPQNDRGSVKWVANSWMLFFCNVTSFFFFFLIFLNRHMFEFESVGHRFSDICPAQSSRQLSPIRPRHGQLDML